MAFLAIAMAAGLDAPHNGLAPQPLEGPDYADWRMSKSPFSISDRYLCQALLTRHRFAIESDKDSYILYKVLLTRYISSGAPADAPPGRVDPSRGYWFFFEDPKGPVAISILRGYLRRFAKRNAVLYIVEAAGYSYSHKLGKHILSEKDMKKAAKAAAATDGAKGGVAGAAKKTTRIDGRRGEDGSFDGVPVEGSRLEALLKEAAVQAPLAVIKHFVGESTGSVNFIHAVGRGGALAKQLMGRLAEDRQTLHRVAGLVLSGPQEPPSALVGSSTTGGASKGSPAAKDDTSQSLSGATYEGIIAGLVRNCYQDAFCKDLVPSSIAEDFRKEMAAIAAPPPDGKAPSSCAKRLVAALPTVLSKSKSHLDKGEAAFHLIERLSHLGLFTLETGYDDARNVTVDCRVLILQLLVHTTLCTDVAKFDATLAIIARIVSLKPKVALPPATFKYDELERKVVDSLLEKAEEGEGFDDVGIRRNRMRRAAPVTREVEQTLVNSPALSEDERDNGPLTAPPLPGAYDCNVESKCDYPLLMLVGQLDARKPAREATLAATTGHLPGPRMQIATFDNRSQHVIANFDTEWDNCPAALLREFFDAHSRGEADAAKGSTASLPGGNAPSPGTECRSRENRAILDWYQLYPGGEQLWDLLRLPLPRRLRFHADYFMKEYRWFGPLVSALLGIVTILFFFTAYRISSGPPK